MPSPLPRLCYLCGQPIRPPVSQDHVPPRCFFAPEIRQRHQPLTLLTLPTHPGCNRAYQPDEEYFVYALFAFARGSEAGDALYRRVLEKFRARRNVPLTHQSFQEFEARPSGLHLPEGTLVKRFNGRRLQRVAWKIVRGLHFHHHGQTLPEAFRGDASLTLPNQPPPKHFEQFMAEIQPPERGKYPGAFAYRFHAFIEGPSRAHYWAFLLWDRILLTMAFHDPQCGCESCRATDEIPANPGADA